MTEEQKQGLLKFLQEKLIQDSVDATNALEIKMLKAEYDKNVNDVENGINIFKSEPPSDSDYECIGCGA
jgi:hypothetical protein